jgi:hypothetical protein
MRKPLRYLLAGTLLALVLQAQRAPFHYFDPGRIVEIQGVVQKIGLEDTYGKKSKFLVLTVDGGERGSCRVEIGPQWFIQNDIAVGMNVSIRASQPPRTEGVPDFIAQEISIQGERIVLRDLRGFPLWGQRGNLEDGRRGSGRHGRR